MVKKASIILFSLILTTSCSHHLSLYKMPYTGSEFRTDGYYYNEYISGYYTVYFFFKDGTVLYGSSFPTNELYLHEIQYSNGDHYNCVKNVKYYWGTFKAMDNELLFERWYPSQIPFKSYIRSGIILNDTTFKIIEFYRMQGGQKTSIESRNEVYHFKSFSPKPDSTNKFVP